MRTDIRWKRNYAFILSESDVLKILALMQEYDLTPNIRITCGKEMALATDDVQDLFSRPNSHDQKITALRFASRRHDPFLDYSLEFEVGEYADRVDLQIESDDVDRATLIQHKTEALVRRVRQPYSWVTWDHPSMFAISAFAAMFALVCAVLLLQKQHVHLATVMLLILTPIAFKSPIIAFFFPDGIFEVGDGKTERAKYKKRREVLAVSVLITFFLGLLINWSSRLLGL